MSTQSPIKFQALKRFPRKTCSSKIQVPPYIQTTDSLILLIIPSTTSSSPHPSEPQKRTAPNHIDGQHLCRVRKLTTSSLVNDTAIGQTSFLITCTPETLSIGWPT